MWRAWDIAPELRAFDGRPAIVPQAPFSAAIATAEAALPGGKVSFVTFASHLDGSPLHYVVWTQGRTKLRSRLMTPLLLDAVTGKVIFIPRMPWYLRLLEICRPLHFGDYGGLPLKALWVALDGLTIVVLGSGLYLLLAGGGPAIRSPSAPN